VAQLFVVDNCIGDWRIAMSFRSIVQIIVELIVCSIHPVPGSFYFTWRMEHADGETVTTARVPVDLILSLPMFLRLYLVCRGINSVMLMICWSTLFALTRKISK